MKSSSGKIKSSPVKRKRRLIFVKQNDAAARRSFISFKGNLRMISYRFFCIFAVLILANAMSNKRKRRNIIILAALVVMIAAVAVVLSTRKTSTLKQNFTISDVETITKMILSDKTGNKITLRKVADSLWTINDSDTADNNQINTLLLTLKEMRIREPVAKAAHKNILKRLSAERTEIQVYQQRYAIDFWFIHLFKKEKLTKTIYVGSETQDNMGTYMLEKGTNEPAVVYIPHFRGYLVTRFLPYIDVWKSHTIFNCKPVDIAKIKVEIPKLKDESFELYRSDKTFNFKLLGKENDLTDFDTMKVTALLSSFMNLNYESAAKDISKLEKDTIFSKEPNFIITLTDTKGKSRSLRTYVKLNNPDTWVRESDQSDFYTIMDVNRMYAVADGIKDTLLLQFYVMDNILNPASYYFDNDDKAANLGNEK
ncbi:MAG: DUF4340 domain-containing protein [Bacteroidales bacterium]|nr:DUF4340 domain-containing protein [Bacteroidales bacterium]